MGCCIGICENLSRRWIGAGLVFRDHLINVARRRGCEWVSWDCISSQRCHEGVEEVAENDLGVPGCNEERRALRLFQRFRAAVSAACTVSLGSAVDEGLARGGRVFDAVRAFWSLIRVFRRASKVLRWCFIARPLARSALAVRERWAATVVCSSAIILRIAARESWGPGTGLLMLLMLLVSLSPSVDRMSCLIRRTSDRASSSSSEWLSSDSDISSSLSPMGFPFL